MPIDPSKSYTPDLYPASFFKASPQSKPPYWKVCIWKQWIRIESHFISYLALISDSFSPLSLLLSNHDRGLADLFLHYCLFFVLKRLLSPTLCDAPAAPGQSLSGLHWGCVRAVSALIPTERQDVIHKQGWGWRRIIFHSSGLDLMGHETVTFPFNFSWRNGAILCGLRCVWRHRLLSSYWALLVLFEIYKILLERLIPIDALH